MNATKSDVGRVVEVVWSTMLGLELTEANEAVNAVDLLRCLVRVEQRDGEQRFGLLVGCSPRLGQAIAGIMLDTDPADVSDGDATAALAEVTMILAAHLTGSTGKESSRVTMLSPGEKGDLEPGEIRDTYQFLSGEEALEVAVGR